MDSAKDGTLMDHKLQTELNDAVGMSIDHPDFKTVDFINQIFPNGILLLRFGGQRRQNAFCIVDITSS